jgi:hypothetical protein
VAIRSMADRAVRSERMAYAGQLHTIADRVLAGYGAGIGA